MYSAKCQNHAGLWTVDCGLDSGLNNEYVGIGYMTDCLSQGTKSVKLCAGDNAICHFLFAVYAHMAYMFPGRGLKHPQFLRFILSNNYSIYIIYMHT